MTPPLRTNIPYAQFNELVHTFFFLKKYCPQKHLEPKIVTQLVDRKRFAVQKHALLNSYRTAWPDDKPVFFFKNGNLENGG